MASDALLGRKLAFPHRDSDRRRQASLATKSLSKMAAIGVAHRQPDQ